MTLSIALATYNEESNITKFLDTHLWVDEIVIVDGQSDDNTQKIIKAYQKKHPQVKLISKPNQAMFHINKQLAIDAATGDWILQLDADEIVSPNLKTEILSTISSTDLDGFWFNRSNFFLGRFLTKGGQYPDPTLRLYRRGRGHLPCLSVHEQAKVKGQVGHLNHDLLHYADADFSRYLLRNNRYTSLMAEELKQKNIKINPASFLNYFFIKPGLTFLSIYLRHKGFMDGFPGLVFAYYSSISHRAAYCKLYAQNRL